jgi:hypothetical protein
MESKKEIVNVEKASENEYVKKLVEDLKSSLGKSFTIEIENSKDKETRKFAFLKILFGSDKKPLYVANIKPDGKITSKHIRANVNIKDDNCFMFIAEELINKLKEEKKEEIVNVKNQFNLKEYCKKIENSLKTKLGGEFNVELIEDKKNNKELGKDEISFCFKIKHKDRVRCYIKVYELLNNYYLQLKDDVTKNLYTNCIKYIKDIDSYVGKIDEYLKKQNVSLEEYKNDDFASEKKVKDDYFVSKRTKIMEDLKDKLEKELCKDFTAKSGRELSVNFVKSVKGGLMIIDKHDNS